MLTYTTIDGRVLNLSDLKGREEKFFERCFAEYESDHPWADFSNLISGRENPLLAATRGRVTQAVWDNPLYQALRDLEDRLGIKQDQVGALPGDDVQTDPCEDEWLPAPQAAEQKGVTLPGLRKAIARGDVVAAPTHRNGKRLEVSRRSLEHWIPNLVRQAARKKVEAA